MRSGLVEKDYYTLEEIAERWKLPMRDLAYLAENGLLRVSVRLFGVEIERGTFEEFGDGQWQRMPYDRVRIDGLEDLTERDAFTVFRTGAAQVDRFNGEGAEYVDLMQPEFLTVRIADLLVRRTERDRVEAKHGLGRVNGHAAPAFQAGDDYREVRAGGLVFHLGPIQAEVVRHLHVAAENGAPWCVGKVVLGAAGSLSTRMADVFKSQPHWRRLIDSDRRGRYRLRSSR